MIIDESKSQGDDMIFLGSHSELYAGGYKINSRILQF